MGKTTTSDDHLILSALNCVLNDREAVYIVVPVSSGIRLWQLASARGLRDVSAAAERFPRSYRECVVRPNLDDAARVVASLRNRYPTAIDPSGLQVSGWTQRDYRRLWRSVILRKVKLVLLAPGWAYSRGCVDECVTSFQHNIQVADVNGNCVSRAEALWEIERALERSREYKVDVSYLRALHRKLRADTDAAGGGT